MAKMDFLYLLLLCYTVCSLEFNLQILTRFRREGRIMAMKCEYCGKGPSYGNVVSHANNTRRRRWNPNLKSVRALISGARKRVKVCTACIRAGKVKKAA